jgi:S-DNA-T family DNA segregation ATPase FtsK/SpoIIIE
MRKTRQKQKSTTSDISSFIHVIKTIEINPKKLAIPFFIFGIIFLLALISYDRNDIYEWSSLSELINGREVNNFLGIVGANISAFLFEYLFGYASIFIAIWLLIISYRLFFRVDRPFFPEKISFRFHLAFLLSLFLTAPESFRTLGHSVDYFPGGLISGLTTDVLFRMFGKIGAIIIFIVYFIGIIAFFRPKKISAMFFENLFSKIPRFSIQKDEEEEEKISESDEELGTEYEIIEEKETKREILELEDDLSQEERNSFRRKFPPSEQKSLPKAQEFTSESKSEKSLFNEDNEDDKIRDIIDSIKKENDNSESFDIKSEYQEFEEKLKENKDFSFSQEIEDIAQETKFQKSPKNELLDKLFEDEASSDEDKVASEPSFTFEEEIHEKSSNIDKVQKKVGKEENYKYPSLKLLDDSENIYEDVTEEELWTRAKILEDKLLDFKVTARVENVVAGPVITLFEIKPDVGIRVSKIETLMPDISLSLSAKGIRFLGQIPGKNTLGIEIPNDIRKIVTFKEIINSEKFVKSKADLPVVLGKNVNGEIIIGDLADMPHLLIAGATGSGKSVGVNTLIASLLYKKHPDDLKFVMIDPKKLELNMYDHLEHHHLAYSSELDEKVVTTPENAMAILNAVVEEMERRITYLSEFKVRNIKEFNTKVAGTEDDEGNLIKKLPYIVVIIDELADLMMTTGKEVEEPIARITQKARAIGIHAVVATQRPSVNVITGIIKANIPTRIAFQTAQKVDSRTIIDVQGAELLLGKGDMLYLPPGQAKPVRVQNAFLSTEELERVLEHIRFQPFSRRLNLPLVPEQNSSSESSFVETDFEKDSLFEEAKREVINSQTASVSMLQRRFRVGHARAGKIIDDLERAGIISPHKGSKPREVYYSPDELD